MKVPAASPRILNTATSVTSATFPMLSHQSWIGKGSGLVLICDTITEAKTESQYKPSRNGGAEVLAHGCTWDDADDANYANYANYADAVKRCPCQDICGIEVMPVMPVMPAGLGPGLSWSHPGPGPESFPLCNRSPCIPTPELQPHGTSFMPF